MLELIQDYALDRLHAAGEEEQCRRRHAAYYARLAEIVFAYFGPDQGERDAHFTFGIGNYPMLVLRCSGQRRGMRQNLGCG